MKLQSLALSLFAFALLLAAGFLLSGCGADSEPTRERRPDRERAATRNPEEADAAGQRWFGLTGFTRNDVPTAVIATPAATMPLSAAPILAGPTATLDPFAGGPAAPAAPTVPAAAQPLATTAMPVLMAPATPIPTATLLPSPTPTLSPSPTPTLTPTVAPPQPAPTAPLPIATAPAPAPAAANAWTNRCVDNIADIVADKIDDKPDYGCVPTPTRRPIAAVCTIRWPRNMMLPRFKLCKPGLWLSNGSAGSSTGWSGLVLNRNWRGSPLVWH